MAKIIESNKGFKLIECSIAETTNFGGMGICDRCNSASFKGMIIPVLNHWYCPECFEEWHRTAENYPDDRGFETKVFNHFKKIFNLNEESEANNG